MSQEKSSLQEATALLDTDERSSFQTHPTGPEPGYSATLVNPHTQEIDYQSDKTISRSTGTPDKTKLIFDKQDIQKK